MNITQIIEHFSNYTPLNNEEIECLESKLTERKVKRRQFILQEGDVCKHISFVVSGCFKMYKVDTKGTEHNLQFSIENGWIADLGSFHSEKPSELYIEALEASTILQITRPDLILLYTNFPKFDRIFRVLIENAFVSLQKRVLQNISSTAEERYVDFLKTYPSLFNRISNVQIASYIGVTPEFLSKIRKNITSK
ncbi:cAMP-binding proteins - catabolite gene activator and regulatory subunit of cAMP-dependent protein kinases [hydrothermal vent metagenome]|uniref:cAMP-binding proteins - catabolite gene activator and regulatory subunit of cAMP-dependent protein kinases n=1 Tax=hydrothermal vent metagenome TaxID=652676 RepID=A0A3B0QWG3_9ZZZZ